MQLLLYDTDSPKSQGLGPTQEPFASCLRLAEHLCSGPVPNLHCLQERQAPSGSSFQAALTSSRVRISGVGGESLGLTQPRTKTIFKQEGTDLVGSYGRSCTFGDRLLTPAHSDTEGSTAHPWFVLQALSPEHVATTPFPA